MEHADVYELIPVYALGALEEDEAQAVEAHLRECTACRAELAVYEDVADQLALAVPGAEPPPGLREELLARVERPFLGRTATADVPAPALAPAETRPGLWQRLNDFFRKLAPVWVPVSLALIMLLGGGNVLLWQHQACRGAGFDLPAGHGRVAGGRQLRHLGPGQRHRPAGELPPA